MNASQMTVMAGTAFGEADSAVTSFLVSESPRAAALKARGAPRYPPAAPAPQPAKRLWIAPRPGTRRGPTDKVPM